MDMHIRRAEERDIPRVVDLLFQVQAVHAEGRPDLFVRGTRKYSDDELREIFADESRPVLVAEVDGQVQGYAFCIYQQPQADARVPAKCLYIDDLCVDAAARGRHIGTELYHAVLDLARATGCYHVSLNVWCLNESAMAFYEKCGLTPLRITMEKILGPEA